MRNVIIPLVLIIIIIISIAFIFRNSRASTLEYMKNSPEQRILMANERIENIRNTPDKKSEAMISLMKETLYNDVAALLPENCEIISEFHSYTSSVKTVYGGYYDCANKSIEDIQTDYYDQIYGLVVNGIGEQEKMLDEIESRLVAVGIDPETEAVPENTPHDYDELLKEYKVAKEHLIHLQEQKQDMEAGRFYITGIRVKAKNSDLYALAKSGKVLAVEILNFDNNDIITPVITE